MSGIEKAERIASESETDEGDKKRQHGESGKDDLALSGSTIHSYVFLLHYN